MKASPGNRLGNSIAAMEEDSIVFKDIGVASSMSHGSRCERMLFRRSEFANIDDARRRIDCTRLSRFLWI